MEFAKLVEIYDKIEAVSKRLEMTEHLAELLRTTDARIIDRVVYLTQGKLAPDFVGIELGVADRIALKAIAQTTGIREEKIDALLIEKGDLGEAAFDAVAHKKQRALFTEPLDVIGVYNTLSDIAQASGARSQDAKMNYIAELLHSASPTEAKYVVRFLVGKLRLGIADMTIIDALATAFGSGKRGDEADDASKEAFKKERDIIEAAYNIHPDLGKIAKLVKTEGIGAASKIKIELGVPVRSMLAERLPSIDEIFEKMGGDCSVEYKYDGLRIQAHIKKDKITLFSRNLENVTDQFPDVQDALRGAFRGTDCIIDGECVPININTGELLPFQQVSHRRGRKHEMDASIEEYPVVLFMFDCIYASGEPLISTPYTERRKKLKELFKTTGGVRFSEALHAKDPSDIEKFFVKSLGDGCEGIVVKSVTDDSVYRAGARGWQWIKYKKDYKSEMNDTVDLVVVGAFAGEGKRAGAYGALLMAAYNSDTGEYETVSKLGTGFDDKTLFAIPDMLKPYKLQNCHSSVKSEMKPDYWFRPAVVMEVKGAEITLSPVHKCAFGVLREGSGLAIRFPRFTGKWRSDKSAQDATTTKELINIYKHQEKKAA